MSRVTYDDSRLIPSPLTNINKTYTKTSDGSIIGKIYNITLNGTLIAFKGSPDSSGVWWQAGGYPPDEVIGADSRLSSLQRKQEALRDLFSDEGRNLEIQALDATQPVKCNPRVISIDFPEGLWYTQSRYTITLEADELYPRQEDTFTEYINDASESWVVETDEAQPEGLGLPRTYRISHSVSAQGKRFFDELENLEKPAWWQARDYVQSRLGFDTDIALSSGVNNLPAYYGGFNHVRTENIDELGGSYEVSENWLISSGSALEDFNVGVTKGIDSPFTNVTIDGNITGLEQRDSDLQLTTSKYDNAVTKFNVASGLALTRAQTYSDTTLNIFPINQTVGRSPVGGTINYTYEYNNRPILIRGAKSSSIAINDNLVGESFASIFVLGRTNGPVLQNLNTRPALTRSLSMELMIEPESFGGISGVKSESDFRTAFNNKPRLRTDDMGTDIRNVLTAANPFGDGLSPVYSGQPQENWDPINGSYSYNILYTY